MILRRKKTDAYEDALMEQYRHEKQLRQKAEQEALRLTTVAGGMEAANRSMVKELSELRAELADVRDENAALREIIKGLRYRVYMLLRSADVDAEKIGMERYTEYDPLLDPVAGKA